MDNRKIYILLKKDEKGNYQYDSVQFLDDNHDTLKDSNIVVLKEDKYSSLCNQKNTRIVVDSMGDKENVAIVLSDSLMQKLATECKNKGYDTEELIPKLLEHVLSNTLKIQLEKHGGMSALNIQYREKEKEMNGGSEHTYPVSSTDSLSSIDMSKINPAEVITKIKKKVIAQDKTVETIVNNIYNNQLMFDTKDDNLIHSSKSSILMDGPTGTGKTLIVKQVAKELELPLVIQSSTMFSAAGYKGVDLSEMLVALLNKTGGNLEDAERGIIVLDEFDKLGGRKDSELEMKKAVQQELLTYLSGAKFPVEYNGQTYDFDTSRITFICLGAFTDLRERKIEEGLDEDGFYTITPDDYIEEGLLREVVGRFSLITSTKSLGKADLIRILKESEISPLIQLQELGHKIYQKDILYTEEMLEKIAEEALKEDTGARALQTVVNGIRDEILSSLIYGEETQIEITDELLQRVRDNQKRGVAK